MAKPKHPARVAAEAAGERFYEGPPCHNGHTQRYVRGAGCVPCAIERATKQVAADPERRRAYRREWYLRNLDEIKANSAEWRRKNPEQFRATLRQ